MKKMMLLALTAIFAISVSAQTPVKKECCKKDKVEFCQKKCDKKAEKKCDKKCEKKCDKKCTKKGDKKCCKKQACKQECTKK